MKPYPLLFLAAMLAAAIACSPTQSSNKGTDQTPPVGQAVADTTVQQASTSDEASTEDTEKEYTGEEEPTPVTLQFQPLLSSESRELFTTYSLSSLFVSQSEESSENAVVNGFYGNDHHRIEVHFATMTQDPDQPHIYYLTGKTRYKKNITPFSGKMIFESLQKADLSAKDTKEIRSDYSHLYLAKGHFELNEEATAYGAGIFKGEVELCFARKENDDLQVPNIYYVTNRGPKAGFLFEGEWISNKTGKSKPILWPNHLYAIVDEVLEDFEIGERGMEINPKYHHLGWDGYWENEEWWNESPKAL